MAQASGVFRGFIITCVALVLTACQTSREPFDYPEEPRSRPSAQDYRAQAAPPPQRPQPQPGAYDISPTRVVKVGLLVPLSGQSETLGKALQDAAVMALFDKYATLKGPLAATRVELVPEDSKGTAAGARQAAANVMNENAELIIGPLYAQEVEAIKPLAATGKVSMLSFSNNPSVAGDGVFTLGFNPQAQTRRVMRYAFTQGKVGRLAVLAPNNTYGRQVVEAARAEAALFGVEVSPVIRYAPGSGALAQDVQQLVSEGSVGARFNFDALFLPEGGAVLGPMLDELAKNHVNPQTVQFLGTGLWDSRELIEQYDLSGAWFASGPPRFYDAFEQRFLASYGYKPPRIASLAYDAVALAGTLATTKAGFSRDVLTDSSGYSGPANGIFRLNDNGRIERGMAVIEIDGNQFEVIDPAPVQFE